MGASEILALWNVFLCLVILYFPSLICVFVFIKAIFVKKRVFAVVTGLLTVAFGIISSVILYHIIDFITNF